MILKSFLTCLLITYVHCQCLSENDKTNKAANPDLSGITDFALDLLRDVFPYNTSANFFFSPYSIWNALTLAYFGAEGQTATQLQRTLRVADKVDAMVNWKQLQFVYDMRQRKSQAYSFNLANRAFFDNSVKVRSCMTDIMGKEIERLDFSQPEMAAKRINNLVSNVTKGRIDQIVSSNDLTNSRMALVNAAFFKGTWKYQFKKSKTEQGLFYSTPEDMHFVDMMTQKGNFRSGPVEDLGAHMLELPYDGDEISMIVLLPPFVTGEKGFNEMVYKITGPILQRSIEQLYRGQVVVTFPKFKLHQSLGDELMTSLMKMGITDLFDSSLADLTAFDPAGGLSVGKTVHKASVEVSEEGTEASAATALVQFRVARPLEPEVFKCDHPFLFILFDNLTKNILFMGAYKNPRA